MAVSWINNSQHSGGSWIVHDFIGAARVHSRRAFSSTSLLNGNRASSQLLDGWWSFQFTLKQSFCPKKTLEQSCNENVLSRSSEALQNLLDYPDVHNEIFKTVSSFDRFKSAAQLCDIFLFFSFPSIVSVSMSLDWTRLVLISNQWEKR